MKVSYYNYLVENGNNSILYNCNTDEILLMLPEVVSIYKNNAIQPDKISAIHPALFQYLTEKRFLVNNDVNESEEIINRWKEEEEKEQSFGITINPTLDCNMKCWYCYENQTSGDKMNQKVISSVLNLLERVGKIPSYRNICLSFFGGEPLFYFEEVVKPLIEEVAEICKKNDKNIFLHFTTNAFLLNNSLFDYFKNYPTSFQITLDGNERLHNLVKSTKKGEHTYETVVTNIKKALQNGHRVSVRLNYIAKRLPYFLDVISDFLDLDIQERKNLTFNFQRVWQDKGGDQTEIGKVVKGLEEKFKKAGLNVIPSNSNPFGRCYADSNNNVVVNYDGLLFRCTARDFTEKNSDGYISETGEFHWNERYHKRNSIVYGGAFCKACKVYPLCHGGCSQIKLESGNLDFSCLKNYTESDKSEMIADRINDILFMHKAHRNSVETE